MVKTRSLKRNTYIGEAGYSCPCHTQKEAENRKRHTENEKTLESDLVQRVRKSGGIALKFVSPGNDGVPDRIVLFPGGKLWFVELKRETGELSKIQRLQIRRLETLGFRVRVIYGREGLNLFFTEIFREASIPLTAA